MATAFTTKEVPAHVAADRVVPEFSFATAAGGDRDPFLAISTLHCGPDIVYAPHGRGNLASWILTRSELIREVLQDPQTFSSKNNSAVTAVMGESWDLIPLEKDPPEHGHYRTLMNPLFSPSRIDALDADVRRTAVELIETFKASGECNFIADFGTPFPVTVILRLMDLPLEMSAQFLDWEYALLRGKDLGADRAKAAGLAIRDYLLGVIEERRRAPGDDLISVAVAGSIEGRPLNEEEILGIAFMLFLGGLDTVAATLGFVFKHLAEDLENQRLLRAEPALIPNAIEELLRAYPVVNCNRFVTRDIDFHGVRMRKGDNVSCPTMLAGRDEREFPEPHRIDFRRPSPRHITFSAGPHRCIGSHLARRELKIAIEEWLTRLPEFRLKPGIVPPTHSSGVCGVDFLPIQWATD